MTKESTIKAYRHITRSKKKKTHFFIITNKKLKYHNEL